MKPTGRVSQWAATALAFMLVCGFALAQSMPSRARLSSSGLSTAQVQEASGWASDGTDTSPFGVGNTQLHITNSSTGVLRYGTTKYINLQAAGGIDLDPGTGATVRSVGNLALVGKLNFQDFVDDSATTGNRTVNANRGFNAFAAAGTAITITNSQVATTSQIAATIMTNDATAVLKNCVPASGSFTCTLNVAATGITKIAWTVLN